MDRRCLALATVAYLPPPRRAAEHFRWHRNVWRDPDFNGIAPIVAGRVLDAIVGGGRQGPAPGWD